MRNGKKKKINEPEFLKVKLGHNVLAGEDEIGKVLSFVAGARDPDALHFFCCKL